MTAPKRRHYPAGAPSREPGEPALRQGIRPAAACRVVYEDEWLIAVEKPAGLVCAHAPAGQPSVVSWLRESLRTGRAEAGLSHSMVPGPFVGVVSRLDQPVSGIVVFAKTSAAAASLAEQFRTRSVCKTYLAMIEGRFPGRAGEWQEWTDRLPRLPQPAPGFARRGGSAGRGEPPTDGPGQIATTAVRLLDRSGEVSVVELRPTTGRKHQLRRQLALRRCPIVGDRRYGSRIPLGDAAIALHASALGFQHPQDGRPVLVQSRPPALWLERFPAIRLGPA